MDLESPRTKPALKICMTMDIERNLRHSVIPPTQIRHSVNNQGIAIFISDQIGLLENRLRIQGIARLGGKLQSAGVFPYDFIL